MDASGGEARSAFEPDVRDRLAEYGITVVPQYGVGGYRIDFAAVHPDDPARMVLAIEADGVTYRESGSVRDRDRLRAEHLQRLGWSFHRLWSTNWFYDPQAEMAKLRDAYQRATAATGRAAGAEAAGAKGPGAEAAGAQSGGAAGADARRTGPGQELDLNSPGTLRRNPP
jgi:very-short-patch-repair endonuclease